MIKTTCVIIVQNANTALLSTGIRCSVIISGTQVSNYH